ncbi:MAG: DUF1326 domain-containing protein [Terriglobia bacterium]
MKKVLTSGIVAVLALVVWAIPSSAAIQGRYVEVRSADVYTGPCFANSEVGVQGRQAIVAWKISQGEWDGTNLSGLSVVAVVRAKDNLGDPYHNPYPAKSILIVDQRANAAQRSALIEFAHAAGGRLVANVVRVDRAPIRVNFSGKMNDAVTVAAGNLARIQTRSLCAGDSICGNEIRYYPPLTKVSHAMPAYTLADAFDGTGLGVVWTSNDTRSAYVASFHMM